MLEVQCSSSRLDGVFVMEKLTCSCWTEPRWDGRDGVHRECLKIWCARMDALTCCSRKWEEVDVMLWCRFPQLVHVVSWYFESDLWTDIVYPSHSITVYHQRHFKSAVSSLLWEEIFGRVPIFNDRYHWCSTQQLDVTGPVGQLEQPKEWPEAKTHQSVSQSPIRHGFLHRIDVPCSGLVLLAKTYEAFYATQLQLGQWDIYCSGKWRLNVSRTRFISECDDVLCLEVLFDPYERLSTDIRYQHQPQSHTNDATQGSHVNSLRIFNFSFSLVRFNGTMCLGHHRQWHGLNIFEYDGLRTLNY